MRHHFQIPTIFTFYTAKQKWHFQIYSLGKEFSKSSVFAEQVEGRSKWREKDTFFKCISLDNAFIANQSTSVENIVGLFLLMIWCFELVFNCIIWI